MTRRIASISRRDSAATGGFDHQPPDHTALLGCPVPRLTLLFFGAAEDVPEAAKMVTAGTAPPTFRTASQRPNGPLLSNCATTPDEV
jgi:hypothetical protein